jgi:hypothetical protein
MKKELVFTLLIILIIAISGCTQQFSDEELDADLEELSDEELEVALEEDSALAGQAYSRFSSKRAAKVRRARNSASRVNWLDCSEDDGGNSPHQAGEVTYTYSYQGRERTRSKTDRCSSNNEKLYEYYCKSRTKYGRMTYTCANGCEDGACVVVEECSDSDGGENIYQKGGTTGCQDESCETIIETVDCCNSIIGGSFTGCSPTGEGVVEGICEDNVVTSPYITCPSGCQNGACLENRDGDYELTVGDKAIAANGVGIEIVDIQPVYDYGFSIFVNFFIGNQKLNFRPYKFRTSRDSESNFNVIKGIKVNYYTTIDMREGKGYAKLIERDGKTYIKINLESIEEGPITSCHDLVNLCLEKGNSTDKCNKHCIEEATNGEVSFTEDNFLLILPEELEEVGDVILHQMQQCFGEGQSFLPISPFLDKILLRFFYGSNSVVTTSGFGVYWPLSYSENVSETVDYLNGRFTFNDECSDNTLAHELTHYMENSVATNSFYGEGIATYMAEQVAPDDYPINCYDEGWSSESYKANRMQRSCFGDCFEDFYESKEQIWIAEFATHNFENGINITIQSSDYLGEPKGDQITFSVKNSTGEEVITALSGDLYDKNGLVLLFQGYSRGAFSFSLFSDPVEPEPWYSKYSCRDICEVRLENDQVRYAYPEMYLSVPYFYTNQMFYNTGKCFFEMIDETNHEYLVELYQRGEELSTTEGEFCIGRELKNILDNDDYEQLRQRFGEINDDCWPTEGKLFHMNNDYWN